MVGNRTLRVGQYVQAGTQLMAVVPLARPPTSSPTTRRPSSPTCAPGQPVEIEVDMFPGTVFTGHVDSLAPASGQEFALLPPDNATGNFTKVVQRIPVKIVLDPGNPLAGVLRPGMSVYPTIDTKAAATRSPRRRHAPTEPAIERRRASRACQDERRCPARQPRPHRFRPPAGAAPAPEKASLTTWIAVLAGMIGAFMAILNIQITNASLLDIEGGIGTGVDNGAWISTSYLIGEIVVIPLTDYLSRVFSFRATCSATPSCSRSSPWPAPSPTTSAR